VRRAIAVAGAVVLALAVTTQVRSQTTPAATGFDHLDHKTKVTVSAAPEPVCTTCHQLDDRGRPRGYDHSTCFSSCHGGLDKGKRPPPPGNQSQRAVCLVCHADGGAPTKKNARSAGAERPKSDPEHAIRLSHASHRSEACESCHRSGTEVAGPTHARCRSCHERRARPRFDECEGCHIGQVGQLGPTLQRHLLSVASKFDHQDHRKRSSAGCRDCHVEIQGRADDQLPPPRKSDCGTCHDGRKAFDMIGPSCTRCHSAPAVPLPATSVATPFDHQRHRRECSTCHTLDRDGDPTFARTVHQSCAQCHRDEFSSLEATICTTCHISAEPWRPLHVERRQRSKSAFTIGFDHLAHGSPEDCQRCHSGRIGGSTPSRHSGCAGSACHLPGKGPAPRLEQCSSCHLAAVDDRREANPWSVAASFDHDRHRTDPRTAQALPCRSCHVGTLGPPAEMPTPAKAQCAPCHDGKTAFKITGHSCRKCHR